MNTPYTNEPAIMTTMTYDDTGMFYRLHPTTTPAPTVVPVGDVTTEAGAVITDVHIAYHGFGELTIDTHGRSNVILVEHALTGDSHCATWWADLIGPGKVIDTNIFYVMCTNVLGGCYGTTGPSSPHPDDGKPWGSRFPAISVKDQVTAEKKLLDKLGIAQVVAVIGGSMGGARSLEWALTFPERIGTALVMAVSARASAWQIGIQCAQIAAITHDEYWCGGDYYLTGNTPVEGLKEARTLAHLTYRGELEMDERFGVEPQEQENPLGKFRDPEQRFAICSYLDYQGDKLVARFDAGSYVAVTEAMNRHDVGRGRGGLNKALGSCSVPTMIAGVDTDILYPFHQQEHLARNIGALIGMAKISSPLGHDAFLAESRQMDTIVRRFFRESSIAHRFGLPLR